METSCQLNATWQHNHTCTGVSECHLQEWYLCKSSEQTSHTAGLQCPIFNTAKWRRAALWISLLYKSKWHEKKRLSWALKMWNEMRNKNSAVCGNVLPLTVNNRSNVASACSADKNYRKQHSWTSKCNTNTEEVEGGGGGAMERKEGKRERETGTEREEKTNR